MIDETPSTWNHRVVKTQDGAEDWYGIHEAYYDQNGELSGWTRLPVQVAGNSIQELRTTLTRMLECLDREVIQDTFGPY